MRIELTTKAWEAFVLPLNYARKPRCYMIVARLFEKSTQKSCYKIEQSLYFMRIRLSVENRKRLRHICFEQSLACRFKLCRYGVAVAEFVVH